MIYRHKDDCMSFPMDADLKEMIDSITKHKDIQSEKFGWEFVSMTTIRKAPLLEGQMGMLVWVISFRQPIEENEADIPIEQMPLSGN